MGVMESKLSPLLFTTPSADHISLVSEVVPRLDCVGKASGRAALGNIVLLL